MLLCEIHCLFESVRLNSCAVFMSFGTYLFGSRRLVSVFLSAPAVLLSATLVQKESAESAGVDLGHWMSASLADSAGRLLACRMRRGEQAGSAGSPLAESGWLPDIRFSTLPKLTFTKHFLSEPTTFAMTMLLSRLAVGPFWSAEWKFKTARLRFATARQPSLSTTLRAKAGGEGS